MKKRQYSLKASRIVPVWCDTGMPCRPVPLPSQFKLRYKMTLGEMNKFLSQMYGSFFN